MLVIVNQELKAILNDLPCFICKKNENVFYNLKVQVSKLYLLLKSGFEKLLLLSALVVIALIDLNYRFT
jgi:hypothetical protein